MCWSCHCTAVPCRVSWLVSVFEALSSHSFIPVHIDLNLDWVIYPFPWGKCYRNLDVADVLWNEFWPKILSRLLSACLHPLLRVSLVGNWSASLSVLFMMKLINGLDFVSDTLIRLWLHTHSFHVTFKSVSLEFSLWMS
jgi:hypothetical protein